MTGCCHPISWLVMRFGVSWAHARQQLRWARALRHMPATARAWEAGEVSSSAVRVLLGAREADAEAFGRCEGELVRAAQIHSVRDLCRVVAYWRLLVEAEGGRQAQDRRFHRRGLYASMSLHGMVRVDGELDPETGESLLTALRAVCDHQVRSAEQGELRTPAQSRADALGEICRQWLDMGNRPTVAGERPHVTLTVDLQALRGLKAGSTELEHTGPVAAEVGRRLVCDASITRVVMAGASEPLDVGRRTPVVSPAIRRGVIVRDAHCRFPSCDRPQGWCEAHHLVHWADGGATSLQNLLLLCRPHHRLVHQGFRLQMDDGHPVFRRPDGSVIEDRAPP